MRLKYPWIKYQLDATYHIHRWTWDSHLGRRRARSLHGSSRMQGSAIQQTSGSSFQQVNLVSPLIHQEDPKRGDYYGGAKPDKIIYRYGSRNGAGQVQNNLRLLLKSISRWTPYKWRCRKMFEKMRYLSGQMPLSNTSLCRDQNRKKDKSLFK